MMKKYIALATASIIGLATVAHAAAPTAQANGPETKMGKPHSGHKMQQPGELPRELQELNLSNKQKAQIQKIMEANRPAQQERPALDATKRAEMAQKMQQHRQAEQNLITSKHFDEVAARQLVNARHAEMAQNEAQRRQLMADMEVKRLQERHDIFQVLTAKQQKQLLENQQKRQQERANRQAKHGQPGEARPGEDRPAPAPQN